MAKKIFTPYCLLIDLPGYWISGEEAGTSQRTQRVITPRWGLSFIVPSRSWPAEISRLFSIIKLGERGEDVKSNILHLDRDPLVLQTFQQIVCVLTVNPCHRGKLLNQTNGNTEACSLKVCHHSLLYYSFQSKCILELNQLRKCYLIYRVDKDLPMVVPGGDRI